MQKLSKYTEHFLSYSCLCKTALF